MHHAHLPPTGADGHTDYSHSQIDLRLLQNYFIHCQYTNQYTWYTTPTHWKILIYTHTALGLL